MPNYWTDPFLWIHVAGVMVFPLWLGLMLIGLASGDPLLSVGVEETVIALIGIVPIFAMQWHRPFYIFSAIVLALDPQQLSLDRRRILTAFITQDRHLPKVPRLPEPPRFLAFLSFLIDRFRQLGALLNRVVEGLTDHRIITGLVALLMFFLSKSLYEIAPFFQSLSPIHPGISSRLLGLSVACVGFLGANLFIQVPAAVLRILFTYRDKDLFDLNPVEPTDIDQRFTILGTRRTRLLDRFAPAPIPDPVEPEADQPPEATSAESADPPEAASDSAMDTHDHHDQPQPSDSKATEATEDPETQMDQTLQASSPSPPIETGPAPSDAAATPDPDAEAQNTNTGDPV